MVKTGSGKIVGNTPPYEGRVVMSVPEAGRLLEMSKDAAYRAAHAGQIPTIRVGNLYKVPVKKFLKMLEG